MKNLKYLLLFVFIFKINSLLAQDYNLVNLLPPSPNAASLGKYAGAEVGLSSGTANFSIQLYEYSTRNLKVPISIAYTTNGFRVDEIASRAGNQWRLNLGGVITRTVLGSIDEKVSRIYPNPPLAQATNRQIFLFEQQLSSTLSLQGVGPNGSVDGQPDMFTYDFNGYNGKFILDTIRSGGNIFLKPVLLSNTGLKIDNQGVSNFTITTPDGVKFFFGDDATESTTSYQTGTAGDCGNPYASNVPTAWYLNKIIHPDGETINFYYSHLDYDYVTGANQTVYAFTGTSANVACGTGTNSVSRPVPVDSYCENRLLTHGILLDSVASSIGNKIRVNYIARSDYNNDKLVSSIDIYAQNHTTIFKSFKFNYSTYSYRPFLIKLSETDGVSSTLKAHSFKYIDTVHIPLRLTYSQDYWGYFNGKSNSSLIPKPKDPTIAQSLPSATANRDPDPQYAQVGLLNVINYPTGGRDSIVYEGNQAYQNVTTYPSRTSVSVRTKTYSSQTIDLTSDVAVVSYQQQVVLSATCTSNTSMYNSLDQLSYEIIDANNNPVVSRVIRFHESASEQLVLAPGSYRLHMHLYGTNVKGSVDLSYSAGNIVTQLMNANVGGTRIAKILTFDSPSATPMIKKYLYTKISDPTQSSAGYSYTPIYERSIKMYKMCTGANGLACNTPAVGFDFVTSSSNALLSLFRFSTPVTYSDVTESYGDNFENGGIEHVFTVSGDRKAGILGYLSPGEQIIGAPQSNYSYKNGLENYKGTFKVQGTVRVPVKKVFTHYKEDQSFAKTFIGYVGQERYHAECTLTGEPNAVEKNSVILNYYNIFKTWVYPDTVTTYNYNSSGTKFTTDKIINVYNIQNALQASVKTYESNGDTLVTHSFYPTDFSATAPYSTMISQNIISPVVLKIDSNGVKQLNSVRSNYKDWGSNNFEVETVESRMGTGAYSTRLRYYNYDNLGNTQCVSVEKGPKVCYVWGYNGLFPIAKIENAEYSTIVSVLGGTAAIDNFKNIPNPSDTQVSNFLSPLRVATSLKYAFVISNTYDRLSGITSSTNAKGEKTTFEYDNFQRLVNVKDKDGNIIKHMDYHYRPQ